MGRWRYGSSWRESHRARQKSTQRTKLSPERPLGQQSAGVDDKKGGGSTGQRRSIQIQWPRQAQQGKSEARWQVEKDGEELMDTPALLAGSVSICSGRNSGDRQQWQPD